jgi:DNA polymerase phi
MFSSEKTSKKSKKSRSKSAPPSEDEPSPIDILVDVIIGFLENANAFTRSVANESFSRVTSAVQGSTVDLILSVSDSRLSYFPNSHRDENSLAIGTAESKRVGRRRRGDE